MSSPTVAAVMLVEKTCCRCGQVKPATAFGIQKRAARRDTLRSICKPCAVVKTSEWVAANPERRKANWRRHSEENRDSYRASHRKYYEAHREEYMARLKAIWEKRPEKKAARKMVWLAVRSGQLTKTDCQRCGNPKVTAHHPDYSKPLEVVWLCYSCHGKEHRRDAA